MKRFDHRYKITISDQRVFSINEELICKTTYVRKVLILRNVTFFSKLAKVDVSRFANKLLKYITELIYGWSRQKFI